MTSITRSERTDGFKIQGREGVAISATRGTRKTGGGSGSSSRIGFPEVCLLGWFWFPGVGCGVSDDHPLFPDCPVIQRKFKVHRNEP